MRIPIFQPYDFSFFVEPMAAVRLNYNARFTAKEGTPEKEYVRWKDGMRDLFDQLDYRDHSIGIPFHEPLLLSGSFHLGVPGLKDLDNLIKALLDSMNLSRRKDWSQLRTFLWTDDRVIKAYSKWFAVPAFERQPEIKLRVVPLLGRIDPMINYLDANFQRISECDFNAETEVGYPFRVRSIDDASLNGPDRVWVLDIDPEGVLHAVSHPAQVIFFRELCKVPKLGSSSIYAILATPWDSILEGLETGKAKHWSSVSLRKASYALSVMRERCPDPERAFLDLQACFDQAKFERCARMVSETVAYPWATVRGKLAYAGLDWTSDFVESQSIALIEECYGSKSKRALKRAAGENRTRRRKLAAASFQVSC